MLKSLTDSGKYIYKIPLKWGKRSSHTCDTVNNNSSFLNEGVAHCPEKKNKAIQKKYNQNQQTITGSCAFFFLSNGKHLLIPLQIIPTNDEWCKHTLRNKEKQILGEFAAIGPFAFKTD